MDVREALEVLRRPDHSDTGPVRGGKGMWVRIWGAWRLGLMVAVAVATGFASVSAWLTPRDPITTTEALVSMVAALLIGLGAGLVTGRRWSLLALPAVYIVVFELVRMGTVGATVDAIYLGSFYGIVAFVLGRVFHGILVLVPMMLGVGYGAGLAARLVDPSASGRVGWTVGVMGTLSFVALGFFIARPASTAPILGVDHEPLPGSVAELVTVPIGGHDQVLMIRGRNTDNRVLLYLTGGPGGTDLGAIRRDTTLEQDFTVEVWEQPGAFAEMMAGLAQRTGPDTAGSDG